MGSRQAVVTALVRSLAAYTAGLVGPADIAAAAATMVTIAGSFYEEPGCRGDWQPECAATHLSV
jgi:hypothetical protein